MKKFYLLFLLCMLTVFMITGCSDSDDNNGGGNSDGAAFPTDLLGTYQVTFFGSQVINPRDAAAGTEMGMEFADLLYVSNDCEKAKKLYPDVITDNEKNQCNEDSTILDGTIVISKTDDGKLAITSRIQMEKGNIEQSPSDKYQFTEYYPTSDLSDLKGKGVTGWNYDTVNNQPSKDPTDFPESPYQITKNNEEYRIDMTLVGKRVKMKAMGFVDLDMTVDAKTTVIMEKKSDSTEKLENKVQKPFTSNT